MTNFKNTLIEISDNIKKLAEIIDEQDINNIINLIHYCRMTFVYGAGRSGLVGRTFAHRLMHLGLKACFIGDTITHRFTNQDILIAISGSGETTSTVAITKKAKDIGGKIVLITSNPDSEIGKISDIIINLKSKTKVEKIKSLAPYTSLFDTAAFALFDSMARVLMDELEIGEDFIHKRHATVE
ncbi:MAG: 6-phospho-3-hexuloisomerase [Candidatus Helarchaeota archaeon]